MNDQLISVKKYIELEYDRMSECMMGDLYKFNIKKHVKNYSMEEMKNNIKSRMNDLQLSYRIAEGVLINVFETKILNNEFKQEVTHIVKNTLDNILTESLSYIYSRHN